ncbi:MAG: hypothetical protein H6683_06795 [Deltaproteobacteria bacterium]|nr:hypothetical protein [Deltaproteobacteria bacterium]
MHQRLSRIALIALALALIMAAGPACLDSSNTEDPASPSSDAHVRFKLSLNATLADELSQATITVTGADMDQIVYGPYAITRNNIEIDEVLEIPKGEDRTFALEIYDTDGELAYQGETTQSLVEDAEDVTIEPTGYVQLKLELHELTGSGTIFDVVFGYEQGDPVASEPIVFESVGGGSTINAVTGDDGTVQIDVPASGSYRVYYGDGSFDGELDGAFPVIDNLDGLTGGTDVPISLLTSSDDAPLGELLGIPLIVSVVLRQDGQTLDLYGNFDGLLTFIDNVLFPVRLGLLPLGSENAINLSTFETDPDDEDHHWIITLPVGTMEAGTYQVYLEVAVLFSSNAFEVTVDEAGGVKMGGPSS